MFAPYLNNTLCIETSLEFSNQFWYIDLTLFLFWVATANRTYNTDIVSVSCSVFVKSPALMYKNNNQSWTMQKRPSRRGHHQLWGRKWPMQPILRKRHNFTGIVSSALPNTASDGNVLSVLRHSSRPLFKGRIYQIFRMIIDRQWSNSWTIQAQN